LAVAISFVLLIPWASAQDKPPAPAKKTPAAQSEPDMPSTAVPKGDVITLKSGHKLIGQVKGQSAGTYVLEVHPGVELDVPRDLVANITYDNIDAREGAQGKGAHSADQGTNVIESARLSTELNRKLYKPLSDGKKPIVFPEHDLVGIMKDLSKRAGVTINIDQSVADLSPAKLAWNLKIPADTTLFDLLHDDFSDRFPNLSVNYKYDRIVIQPAKKNDTAINSPSPTRPQPNQ